MILSMKLFVNFSGEPVLNPAVEKRIKKIQEENLKLLEMFNDFPFVTNPLWKTTIEEGIYMHKVRWSVIYRVWLSQGICRHIY